MRCSIRLYGEVAPSPAGDHVRDDGEVYFPARWDMKTDDIFLKPRVPGDFVFDAAVADVFDDMLLRSVPFYQEQQRMVVEIARTFLRPDTRVHDLGCSTGTALINLGRTTPEEARFVGHDNSEAMLEKARANIAHEGLADRIELRHFDLNGELARGRLDRASVVLLCWTLQFVQPVKRDPLIRWIYDALAPQGALIVTEKVLTRDSAINRLFIDFYQDLKRRNRYSEVEIARKREALENVLIPYSLDENIELFRRSGFRTVETFFQWYNFAGFLCVKDAP